MTRNALFMAAVVLMAAVLIAMKLRFKHPEPAASRDADPTVILVADLREANEPGDNCGEIIHLVREAQKSGIASRKSCRIQTRPC